MKFFKLLTVAALVMCCAVSDTLVSEAKKFKQPKYHNPTGNEFPIMGWHSFCRPYQFTIENYKTYKECGFNMAMGFVANEHEAVKMLELCEKVGLKGMFRASYPTEERCKKIALGVKGQPALAGIMLPDEPYVRQFDTLAFQKKVLLEYSDPSTLIYVNVVAGRDYARALGTRTYPEFMDVLLKVINPQFFSYDDYCILQQKDGSLKLKPNYFDNLEMVSSRMKKAGIPFWTFVLSWAHHTSQYTYPAPDYGQMSFQAFSGLAYGSQCIQYYAYAPQPADTAQCKFTPFTPENKKTYLWYDVQRLNRKIQSLSPILLGMKVKKVWHTGTSIPEGTTRLGTGGKPSGLNKISYDGIGVVVNQFSNGKKNYMMIVNRDFQNPQKVVVEHTGKMQIVPESESDIISKEVSGPSVSINLNAGTAVIFTLN